MSWRKVFKRAAIVLILATAVAAAVAGFRQFRRVQAAEALATAPARQGDFLVIVRCRGELRARRSAQITAPRSQFHTIAPAAPPLAPISRAMPAGARGQRVSPCRSPIDIEMARR